MSRRKIAQGKSKARTKVFDANRKQFVGEEPAAKTDKELTTKSTHYVRVRGTSPGSGRG